jgi:5-methylcytosine-specific restriction endonuclease McrA
VLFVKIQKSLSNVLDFYVCSTCYKREKYRIRKNNARKVKEKLPLHEWLDVLRTHDSTCVCCGSNNKLTIEHIVEICIGGTNTKENITVFCTNCNNKKSKINDRLFSNNPVRVLEGLYLKKKYKHLFPNMLEIFKEV